MKVVPLRLTPGDDLRQALETWMAEQEAQAGCVISAVGSLSLAQLRLAGETEATAIHGELEILSLTGTLSPDDAHLHIAVADSMGVVIGGHLCAGSLVRTYAGQVLREQVAHLLAAVGGCGLQNYCHIWHRLIGITRHRHHQNRWIGGGK